LIGYDATDTRFHLPPYEIVMTFLRNLNLSSVSQIAFRRLAICLSLLTLAPYTVVLAQQTDGPETSIYDSQEETVPKMKPQEVVETTRLPDGFQLQVAASEPDVQQPIAMAWDARGKLWIAENYTYAESSKRVDMQLSDRVIVLEDKENDGVYETRKIFAEGLKGLTSVEVGPLKGIHGVWALAPPRLLFFADANGDDVADGPPEVVLEGFNDTIRHNFANGLKFGPDGWLYGRHGILGQSLVYPPMNKAENQSAVFGRASSVMLPQKTMLTCGIWRFHPKSHRVEMVCEGTTNPWGMDWDKHGNLFFINTVIGHLWHAIPNAHLQRMYGEDSDPHTYELLPQIADHVHWDDTQEDWRETRKGPPSSGTDAAGGGHAHSGLMIYQADQWPKEYRGDVFAINLHGRRINRDHLERSGVGFTAKHGQDMAFWKDLWFRGLDLAQSPDGSVVIIDWSDIGECHDDDGVHRTSGRVYRLKYVGGEQVAFEKPLSVLKKLFEGVQGRSGDISSDDILSVISHPNVWYTHQLLKLLQVRAVAIVNPKGLLAAATTQAKEVSEAEGVDTITKQLRAIWAAHAAGILQRQTMLQIMRSQQSEVVHTFVAKLLVDTLPLPSEVVIDTGLSSEPEEWVAELEAELLDTLFANAKPSTYLDYSLAMASALPRLRSEFESMLTKLLARDELSEDLTYNLVLWYGMKGFVAKDPNRVSRLLLETRLMKIRELAVRRLATMVVGNDPDGDMAKQALEFYLADVLRRDNLDVQASAIKGLWGAYQGRSQGAKVPYWTELMQLGDRHPDPVVQRLATLLSGLFDADTPLEKLVGIVEEKTATMIERRNALEAIGGKDSDAAREVLMGYLQDGDLGNAAGFAMRRTLDAKRAEKLLERFADAVAPAKSGILAALASRPETMDVLLIGLEKGTINKDSVDANTWRQFVLFADWKLLERARKFNPNLGLSEDTQKMIELKLAVFTPEKIAQGNRDRGRAIWVQKCGNCHKLFGTGGEIGPELTGAQRSNLRYWLENILAPSNVVAANYRVTLFRTFNGEIITGVPVSETETEVTVQTSQARMVIPVEEIESRKKSELSLMPEGLLDPLATEERIDLFHYLMSDPQ
jgi:putative membrane-bound dehydrogenase-like protein